MKGDCCSDRPRYWIATATYIAECANDPSVTVSVTRQGRSELSEEHAKQVANELAKAEAEAELVCTWTATQCVVAPCAEPWYPQICAEAESHVSQEDATTRAVAAANTLAAEICAGTSTSLVTFGTEGVLFGDEAVTFATLILTP